MYYFACLLYADVHVTCLPAFCGCVKCRVSYAVKRNDSNPVPVGTIGVIVYIEVVRLRAYIYMNYKLSMEEILCNIIFSKERLLTTLTINQSLSFKYMEIVEQLLRTIKCVINIKRYRLDCL